MLKNFKIVCFLLIVILYAGCKNNDTDKNKYVKLNEPVFIKNIDFSAGTNDLTYKNSIFLWKLKQNKNLHEFARVSFFDSVFIQNIKITSDTNINQILISYNDKIINTYTDFKNIKIDKKIKNITFVITGLKNQKIQNQVSENNIKYSLLSILHNNKNETVKILFQTDSSQIIKQTPIAKNLHFKNNTTRTGYIFNKRIINLRNTKKSKLLQSILLTSDGHISFFKERKSKKRKKIFIGNGFFNQLNDSTISIELKLFNLQKPIKASFTNTFMITDKFINGGKLFRKIYTGIYDTSFVNILDFDSSFTVSMRYATDDNFLNIKLYECSKCLLRYIAAKDLIEANKEVKKYGFHMKLYDCYRPHFVQVKMWKLMPVVGYVADPATGSRHNRGTAVDVSLIDSLGKELEMGTAHDYFGKEAHTFYFNLPDTVKKNRLFLRKIMENHNFSGINSEWWHFSHNVGARYPVSNKKFDCSD